MRAPYTSLHTNTRDNVYSVAFVQWFVTLTQSVDSVFSEDCYNRI